ncbi:MAG: serpin family protein [Oscillospiraceae bacterium]|nr:serpin family protein [Oscillospiraceae bacterium]
MKKRIAASALAALLAVTSFTGCRTSSKSKNLVEDIKPNPVPVYKSFDKNEQEKVAEFAAQIIRNTESENGNLIVSPVSVLYALAMTANGADAKTLAQMEYVFGMDIQTLNDYLHSTVSVLPSDEGYTLDIANSLWITNDEGKFVVNKDFLSVVKSYYDAGVFSADFTNKGTINDINDWVTRQTNGQIQNILEKVDPSAVMYLVNAINFEADWIKEYTSDDVRDGIFTRQDGSTQDAEFMYMNEYAYLEDENTTGFIKYYKDKKYAFVGLLPAENIKMEDYLKTLSGEKITNLLGNISEEKVVTGMPKFEVTYGTEMSEIFKALGMTDAFNAETADFTKMGQTQTGENVCIDKIIHKAFIRVAEKGTQAGAATVVGMMVGGAAPGQQQPKKVFLDRPFVYMIIDTENNLPLFMGTVCEIE